MRILVLSNKCPPDYDGGYELSAFQVANALRGRGYDVHVATSHFRPSYKDERKDPDWVHRIFDYREWPSISGSGFGRALQDAKRLAFMTTIGLKNGEALDKFVEGQAFDLAYCFGLHGIGLATAFPLARRQMPILWHAGNYLIAQDMQLRQLFGRERAAHRFGMHVLSWRAKKDVFAGDYRHIAFLSEAMKREFVRMGFEPAHSYVIPRGIDFPLAEDIERPRTDPPVFVMASRVAEEKGYDVAIDAGGLLTKSKPDSAWELHIAGSGRPEYIGRLKEKARSNGIEDRVTFLGMLGREAVLEAMRQSTAFISASLWEEPFGRTNIEALACGVPLIAAQTGAISEIVGDSGCALVYEKTSAKELSAAMERVLLSSHLGHELAHKGIERIKHAYTMDRILDLTEEVFGKVMLAYGKPFRRPSERAV